jgi:fluoroacetyl-CoA thioesterase
MKTELRPGITHSAGKTVQKEDSAEALGSGLVPVFATPALVALMENVCMQAVLPFLPEGYHTVGTEICIRHMKATPVGMLVECSARLEEASGKKLRFSVTAKDEQGLIGEGTHTRYIIHKEDFIRKVYGDKKPD